jgi:hypothetical protein
MTLLHGVNEALEFVPFLTFIDLEIHVLLIPKYCGIAKKQALELLKFIKLRSCISIKSCNVSINYWLLLRKTDKVWFIFDLQEPKLNLPTQTSVIKFQRNPISYFVE